MIYTCTITPSLDYTTYLPDFQAGKLNRSNDVYYYPGGKGINVSRVLQRLDVESIAVGFVGGFVGDYIKEFLHAGKYPNRFYPNRKDHTHQCENQIDGRNRTEWAWAETSRERSKINCWKKYG